MRRFWTEIQEHRIVSGVFLAYWALAYTLHIVRWHAPAHTGDIVPPVLLLHALLPLAAGALAAWWRGPHPGRVLDGILAGAGITLADFVLISLHDALKFRARISQGGGGEILELPVWFAFASLLGALLGWVGAAGGAAFGGRVASAEYGRTAALSGRSLLAAAGLAWIVAVAIPVAVIPAVAADTSPGATPDRAVPALATIAVLTACAGIAFFTAKLPGAARAGRSIAIITALLVIALGALLAAAGSAAVGHPRMGMGGLAGFALSALGNVTAGILALVAVFRTGNR